MPRPPASSPEALQRMRRQRRRDTAPEVALRAVLHRAGLRFRVERHVLAGLRRRADIVFGPAKVVVFVDGCFWHRCPLHASAPQSNAEWWQDKLTRNVERDRDTDAVLTAAGWAVIRVWEHEDAKEAAGVIADLVRARRSRH